MDKPIQHRSIEIACKIDRFSNGGRKNPSIDAVFKAKEIEIKRKLLDTSSYSANDVQVSLRMPSVTNVKSATQKGYQTW